MIKYFLFSVLLISQLFIFAQDSNNDYHQKVIDFVDLLNHRQIEKLADRVVYPIDRPFPLEDIKTKTDFIARFDTIFDESFIMELIFSGPSCHWQKMGFEGIMYNNGELWLNLEGDIIAINRVSVQEKQLREAAIAQDRKTVHASLKNYVHPVLFMKTKRFHIRVDELESGDYRYASWPLNTPMSEKPDIVVKGGKRFADDFSRSYRYDFHNGDYKYEVSVVFDPEEGYASGDLHVYEGLQVLLRHIATEVIL